MRRVCAAVFALAAVSLVVVAATSTSASGPRDVVEVTFDEWRVEAGNGPVRAGRVTFAERNSGAVEHDFAIVRTDRAPGALPMGLSGVVLEAAGEVVLGRSHSAHDGGPGGHSHAEDHLRPGASRTRSVVLSPGAYVLVCPIPGHYEQGQAAAITVR